MISGCWRRFGSWGWALLCWPVEKREIAGRGYEVFRLRVVRANAAAVGFYQRQGWEIRREFRHERLPVEMLEMSKARVR